MNTKLGKPPAKRFWRVKGGSDISWQHIAPLKSEITSIDMVYNMFFCLHFVRPYFTKLIRDREMQGMKEKQK